MSTRMPTASGTLVPFYSALLFRYSSAAEGPAFQLLRTVPMQLTQLLWEKYMSCLSLGLAIVRKAVEAMHGRVAVTSEVGTGSTFSIILPVSSRS